MKGKKVTNVQNCDKQKEQNKDKNQAIEKKAGRKKGEDITQYVVPHNLIIRDYIVKFEAGWYDQTIDTGMAVLSRYIYADKKLVYIRNGEVIYLKQSSIYIKLLREYDEMLDERGTPKCSRNKTTKIN